MLVYILLEDVKGAAHCYAPRLSLYNSTGGTPFLCRTGPASRCVLRSVSMHFRCLVQRRHVAASFLLSALSLPRPSKAFRRRPPALGLARSRWRLCCRAVPHLTQITTSSFKKGGARTDTRSHTRSMVHTHEYTYTAEKAARAAPGRQQQTQKQYGRNDSSRIL